MGMRLRQHFGDKAVIWFVSLTVICFFQFDLLFSFLTFSKFYGYDNYTNNLMQKILMFLKVKLTVLCAAACAVKENFYTGL